MLKANNRGRVSTCCGFVVDLLYSFRLVVDLLWILLYSLLYKNQQLIEQVEFGLNCLFFRLRKSAKYCDEHVCMSVCLSVCPVAYLKNRKSKLHEIFHVF